MQCVNAMTISSRTPEGQPSKCVLCGARADIEFSTTGGDAPCPSCGHLLWASAQVSQAIITHCEDLLATSPGAISANTRFSDLGPLSKADSLDLVELLMEFEEEFDVDIPDETAERMHTIGDVVRAIMNYRRGARG